ncbi:hypothetical protein HDE_10498 [Halotydeus destructor]|nr:hypothetical protein HDE_10498 [Halotydeus destructor]
MSHLEVPSSVSWDEFIRKVEIKRVSECIETFDRARDAVLRRNDLAPDTYAKQFEIWDSQQRRYQESLRTLQASLDENGNGSELENGTNIGRNRPLSGSQNSRQSRSPLKSPKPVRSADSSPDSSNYLLISKCHTGKPLTERSPVADGSKMPTFPLKSSRSFHEDHTDSPRQSRPPKPILEDILQTIPPPPSTTATLNRQRQLKNAAPQVNWSTFPKDFVPDPRASVRSCNASFETSQNPRQNRNRFDTSPDPNNLRSASPESNFYANRSEMNLSEDAPPPPRPPKPPSLRSSKEKSGSCSSLPTDLIESNGSPLEMTNKNAKVLPSKLQSSKSYGTEVSPNPNKQSPMVNDSLYDFPRPHGGIHELDIVPNVPNTIPRSGFRTNIYGNAPSGFRETKESVFTYDYRPSLPTSCDDGRSMFSYDHESERSPRTPNSANLISNNCQTPPAVNRDLKPRRKNSDSDNTNSPTKPTVPFHLSPPPIGTRSLKGFKGNKKAMSASMVNTIPRMPSRSNAKGSHSREASYDDNGPASVAPLYEGYEPKMASKRPVKLPEATKEIQYLDLDLDSDTNSSPRTPNLETASMKTSLSRENGHHHHHHGSSLTLPPACLDDCSTVYKTVDFIKTQAFNQIRQKREKENPQ